jgi:transposase
MIHIGIDVHKVESQVCILTESGEIIESRIRTERERFAAVLGRRPPAKILIESSTESEWVARCLEGLGHEVIVADPNFAAMYATRSRKVKTDRRDARTLAEACRLGAYRPAHRTSDRQRHVRAQLAVREALVRTRARYISLVGALLRREGFRVKSGSAEGFSRRVEQLTLSGQLKSEIAPLLAVMLGLNKQVAWLDLRLEQLAESDATVGRLCSAPSVGPVTAAAFSSTIDEPERFSGAHQVAAYLGLVPSEMSSGEKQRKGLHHQGGQWARAVSAGAGGALNPATAQPAHRGAQGLGGTDRRAPGKEDRRGGAGEADGRDPLRDDARQETVPTGAGEARAASGGSLIEGGQSTTSDIFQQVCGRVSARNVLGCNRRAGP